MRTGLGRIKYTVSGIKSYIFITFAGNMDRILNKRRRKYIGNLLHVERTRQKISQEEIAQRLDIRQDQVSKMESGDRRIDVVELLIYCEELGLSPTQIAAKIESYLFGMGLIHKRPNMKYQRGLRAIETVRVDVSWHENSFKASYGENVPWTLDLEAGTFPELQEKARKCLVSHVKTEEEKGTDMSQWLSDGQYEFQYKFKDARSLLTAYVPYLTLAAISRASGIDQSLLSLYANGKKKPRPHQLERIADAINRIGKEFMWKCFWAL